MSCQYNQGAVAGVFVLSVLFVSACEGPPHQLTPVTPTAVTESTDSSIIAASPRATPAVVSNDVNQLDFTLNNPCTGEAIRWQGPLHVVMRSQSDGSGGYIVGWTQNMQQVIGTGLSSGDTYRLVGVYTYQEHVNPPFPATINREFHRRWISQGNAPDAVVFGYIRLTVDANGVTRLDASDAWSIFAPDCQ
jgi:hypothetical protein